MQQELEQRFVVADTLKRQLDRGFGGLRFEPALERGFQMDYFTQGLPYRLLLLVFSLAMSLAVTLLDALLFGTPPELIAHARPLQFFVITPVLVLAILVSLYPRWQRYSDSALMLAAVVLALSMLSMRTVAAPHGFDTPLEYTVVVIVGVFFLGRLLFWHFFPLAIALTLAMASNEWLFVQPTLDDWYRVMVSIMLVAISCVGGYSFEYVMRDDWLNRRLLEQLSNHDPLTGLNNRREFDRLANKGLRQALREGKTVGLIVLDVDFFKHYNDHYGHQSGDVCLQRIANLLQQSARRALDVCGRYGGEEFVLLWMDNDPLEFQRLSEELQQAIEALAIPHETSTVSDHVTASIGLVTIRPGYHTELHMLMEQADQALYQAKDQGRNRVVARHLRADEARKLAAAARLNYAEAE